MFFSASFAAPEYAEEDSDVLGVLLSCETDLHHTYLQSWEVYFWSLPYILHVLFSTEHTTSSHVNSSTLQTKQEVQEVQW